MDDPNASRPSIPRVVYAARSKDEEPGKDSTGDQEESQTIGINDHKDKEVTENNLLKDLGEDWQRTDHDSNAVPLGK